MQSAKRPSIDDLQKVLERKTDLIRVKEHGSQEKGKGHIDSKEIALNEKESRLRQKEGDVKAREKALEERERELRAKERALELKENLADAKLAR